MRKCQIYGIKIKVLEICILDIYIKVVTQVVSAFWAFVYPISYNGDI